MIRGGREKLGDEESKNKGEKKEAKMKNKKKEKKEKVRSSERIEVNDAAKKGIVVGGYGITLSADKEKLVKLIRGEKKEKKKRGKSRFPFARRSVSNELYRWEKVDFL